MASAKLNGLPDERVPKALVLVVVEVKFVVAGAGGEPNMKGVELVVVVVVAREGVDAMAEENRPLGTKGAAEADRVLVVVVVLVVVLLLGAEVGAKEPNEKVAGGEKTGGLELLEVGCGVTGAANGRVKLPVEILLALAAGGCASAGWEVSRLKVVFPFPLLPALRSGYCLSSSANCLA